MKIQWIESGLKVRYKGGGGCTQMKTPTELPGR